MVLTCRFYEQKYPTLEDVVMVNVRSIADMGAYVHLLEYNNIEGTSKVTYSIYISITMHILHGSLYLQRNISHFHIGRIVFFCI